MAIYTTRHVVASDIIRVPGQTLLSLYTISYSLLLHEEIVAAGLLLLVHLTVVLVDPWPVIVGVAAEGDVQRLEEAVAARRERFGRTGISLL